MIYVKNAVLCLLFALICIIDINIYAAAEIEVNAPLMILEDGTVFQVNTVNKEREQEKVTVYNINYGEYTRPFEENTHEFIVVNDIVVQKNKIGSAGTYIPSNGYVISYTGGNAEFVEKLHTGEKVTLTNVDLPVLPDMYFKHGSTIIPIDQINTLREASQITIYDSSYGTSTKTNAWGMELIVVNNTISRIADIAKDKDVLLDNDSPIPPNGMVISIHSGSPYYKQLHENIKLGDKLSVSALNKLYNASIINCAAYNPRTITDNPAAWDKGRGKPYDGFRGPNQLIIYDSSYGSRTGTNPYGYEVVVNSDGYIISTGGNNLEIPSGGYILSGHGDKVKWFQKYAVLGAAIKYNPDNKELLVVFSPESFVNLADFSIKSAQDSLELARLQYRDIPYDSIESIINTAILKSVSIKEHVETGKYEALANAVKDIQNDADKAYFMTFESLKAENRAVWLRPRDTSIVQIQKRLDMLKELNINTIFLEIYWNGYAIYPTSNDIMQQNPMFKGMDILGIYLKEAHLRGIEVHAWVENFLVDQPVAVKKPEWLAASRKGDNYYLENGVSKYYFLNPALPEVRDFLSGLYKGLVKKYNLDGIQFDYMRYSHSGDYSNDFGYDTYTRQLFAAYAGTDPITLKPSDELWKKWCDFRAYLISSYAYRMFAEVKSIKPAMKISSDVWPEYDKTLVDIFQDPKAWVGKDYINNLIPMSYYLDEGPVVEDIMNSLPFVRGHSQLTSGIATFNKVDTKVLLRQVNAIRAANINGIAIFEFESLFNSDYADALKLGAFSSPSTAANRNLDHSINIILKEIIRKFDDIYIKYNGISTEQADKYKKLISGIQVKLSGSNDKIKAAYQLKHHIEELLKDLNTDSSFNEEIAKRISTDLYSAINIIDAYISDNRFMANHQVRKFQVEMPLQLLESEKSAPVKVKAIFSDNSFMYLDSSQYMIKSDDPEAKVIGDMLKLTGSNNEASFTLAILDSFKFNTMRGVNRSIHFSAAPGIMTEGSALTSSEASYTDVKLDWGNNVIASEILGYVVYRNNKEIARLSADTFHDRSLQPGETYTYKVQGFDASGDIIFNTSKLTVNTKDAPLLTSR